MSNIFLISDTHFSHANILTFKRADGVTYLRPFISVEEMDEYMISNWNSKVKPSDKVYHLGDVTFSNTHLKRIMPRLSGTKILIKGNHDNLKLSQYLAYFKDIRAYHVLDKFVLSHVPIHSDSLSRWRMNLHGHLHDGVVKMIGFDTIEPDTKYLSMCVEHWEYSPVSFEEVRTIARERGLL